MSISVFTLAKELANLKADKAEAESTLNDVKAEIERVEGLLVEAMINEEVQNFNHNGQMFYIANKVFINMKADKKDQAHQWLRDHDYGDMIQQTVNSQSFSAFAKELMGDNDELPDGLGDLVNIFSKNTVGMRKAK